MVTACATAYTQLTDPYDTDLANCPDLHTIANVYSGTLLDLACIPAENAGFFCLVDLPMSLMADSMVLPLSVYRQIKVGPWYDQDVCLQRAADVLPL